MAQRAEITCDWCGAVKAVESSRDLDVWYRSDPSTPPPQLMDICDECHVFVAKAKHAAGLAAKGERLAIGNAATARKADDHDERE